MYFVFYFYYLMECRSERFCAYTYYCCFRKNNFITEHILQLLALENRNQSCKFNITDHYLANDVGSHFIKYQIKKKKF